MSGSGAFSARKAGPAGVKQLLYGFAVFARRFKRGERLPSDQRTAGADALSPDAGELGPDRDGIDFFVKAARGAHAVPDAKPMHSPVEQVKLGADAVLHQFVVKGELIIDRDVAAAHDGEDRGLHDLFAENGVMKRIRKIKTDGNDGLGP